LTPQPFAAGAEGGAVTASAGDAPVMIVMAIAEMLAREKKRLN